MSVERVRAAGPGPATLVLLLAGALAAAVLYALSTPAVRPPVQEARVTAPPAARGTPTTPPARGSRSTGAVRCPPPSSCLPWPRRAAGHRRTAGAPRIGVALATPARDTAVFAGLPVEVAGERARGVHAVRAVVTLAGREIGASFLEVDSTGRFRGQVPLYPVRGRGDAVLFLQDARHGTFLAFRPVRLVGTLPVSVWSPAPAPGDAAARLRRAADLTVSGVTLREIPSVTAALVQRDRTVLAAASTRTRLAFAEWSRFEVRLPLPARMPGSSLSVVVTWTDPMTGEPASGISVPVEVD